MTSLPPASACTQTCHRCHLPAPVCKCVVGHGTRACAATVVMGAGRGFDRTAWFCSQVTVLIVTTGLKMQAM
eukprot:14986258-Alexandrium_andersonii.AAC.1